MEGKEENVSAGGSKGIDYSCKDRWIREISGPDGKELQTARRAYHKSPRFPGKEVILVGVLPAALRSYWETTLRSVYYEADTTLFPDMRYCAAHHKYLDDLSSGSGATPPTAWVFDLDADVAYFQKFADDQLLDQNLRFLREYVHLLFVSGGKKSVKKALHNQPESLFRRVTKWCNPIPPAPLPISEEEKEGRYVQSHFITIHQRGDFLEKYFPDSKKPSSTLASPGTEQTQQDELFKNPKWQVEKEDFDRFKKHITPGLEAMVKKVYGLPYTGNPILDAFRYEETLKVKNYIWASFSGPNGEGQIIAVLFDPTRLGIVEQFLVDGQEFSPKMEAQGREIVSWQTAFSLPSKNRPKKKNR